MLTKDLIKQLQKLVDAHESYVEVMGEHEIMVDVFKKVAEHTFQYAGFSKDIRIDKSTDGVYDIICAFAEVPA